MGENYKVRWGWDKVYVYLYHCCCRGVRSGNDLIPRNHTDNFSVAGKRADQLWSCGQCLMWDFGLVSVLGLRSPLKFAPILLLQLTYKVIWFIAIVLPLLVAGRLPNFAILMSVLFASFIVGDLIAIPFPYVFAKQPGQTSQA